MSDLDGNILATGSKQMEADEESYDIALQFGEDNSFILLDNDNGDEYSGVYILEKTRNADLTYMLKLTFDNDGSEYIGAYGTRELEDHFAVPVVVFQTDDKIFSFLAE